VPNLRRQIKMTPEEVDRFLAEQRTAAICTLHPSGTIHAVAMWYGFLDGALAFETKEKSQKVQNLRRDARVTVLVEAGEKYEELRGVEMVGRAEIISDPGPVWEFGKTIWERYIGPYSEDQQPALEAMMRKRVVIRVVADKVVSWDHRKLAAL
jgi:PPOX class probable F420-dependent enzyme